MKRRPSKASGKSREYLEARKLSLAEWLALLFDPPENVTFIDFQFPTEQHLEEYIATIDQRTDTEITRLLSELLIPTCSLGDDVDRHMRLLRAEIEDPELYSRLMKFDFYRRVAQSFGRDSLPPWQGITWTLDLLPSHADKAIQVVGSYLLAHFQFLPDGRIGGLSDACEVMRAKYIGVPRNESECLQTLLTVNPRGFEHLVERLYRAMDYETAITPPKSDGGRDVLAWRNKKGRSEQLRIECKRYSKPVGVAIPRALLGVVSDEKVNKGVVVTTSRFSKGAHAFETRNPRLELINGQGLVELMNSYLGPRWPLQVETLIAESANSAQVTP